MYEVIILSSEDINNCPVFHFESWHDATEFIHLGLSENTYSFQVNKKD